MAAGLRRAAFDIGSGATKLLIADVNDGSLQELFAREVPVPFAVDWKKSTDGNLSGAIQEEGLLVLRSLLQECDARLVAKTERCAIATEVFRKAGNGPAFLDRVLKELSLPVRVLTQSEEAELGFRTAVALSKNNRTICWDSGGASFQISSLNDDGLLQTYLGSLGTGVVTSMLVEAVQGHSFAEKPSPNPVTVRDADVLLSKLKETLPTAPTWLRKSTVAAIGGPNSMFCVACEALGQREYTASAIREVLLDVTGKSDNELLLRPFCQGELREPPSFILPKIALLLAVMEHCEIEEVSFYSTIGSCPGMLITDGFFVNDA